MANKTNYLSRVTYNGGKDSYDFPFLGLKAVLPEELKKQMEIQLIEKNILFR